jgi:hypothetical protein
LLDALGRSLLSPADAWIDDPIWPALARLAGRHEGSPLGANLPSGADYRLPTGWTVPTAQPAPAAFWAARGGVLRVWSDAGHMLSELQVLPAASADAESGARARRRGMLRSCVGLAHAEARRHGATRPPRRAAFDRAPLAALSGRLTAPICAPLRRWLALALPALRRRLAGGLGDELGPDAADLDTALLARPARLFVTATHVDLVMSLDTVSLPVRLSGLDRSPGWFGDFGRVIQFHFE